MQPSGHAYERLYEFEVIGPGPTPLGSARGFWLNRNSGELEFIGVRVDALAPHMQVIPASAAIVDEGQRTITVPYSADKLRAAPHFGLHDPITQSDRQRIYTYYGMNPAG
jgi:hypothetical protein